MKTFKLKGLDYYVTNVPNKTIACIVLLKHRIGVTENDLDEIESCPDVAERIIDGAKRIIDGAYFKSN